MPADWEQHLARWQAAALLDADAAARMRAFEAERAPAQGLRWPILLALAFGALMICGGVLLFVSAHWDELSPAQRMALLVLMVTAFHAAGAFTSSRFENLAIALHTVGTITLGAGIALTGQIFNLNEHWPSGIMLWALGAAIAWELLRHWTQAAVLALLVPAWLVGEWTVATRDRFHYFVPGEGLCLLAITYLAARRSDDDTPLRRVLTWIGGLALLPACVVLAATSYHAATAVPLWFSWIGWSIALVLPLALSWALRRTRAIWNVVAAAWVVVFGLIAQQPEEVLIYLWCALGAAGLTAWGLHENRRERINLGIAGFAITLLTFYFSSVMDKLGRSASLIGFGVLLLAGGWGLERMRRRLIARVKT